MSTGGPVLNVGDLVRVLSANPYTRLVLAKAESGRQVRITGLGDPLPEPGDLIFVGADGWSYAEEAAWKEHSSIGVVRRILDDELLIDGGLGIVVVGNGGLTDLQVNNTVEYNDVDGVIRVLTEDAVRSRDWSSEENSADDYRVAAAELVDSFEDFGGYPEVIERARELIETQLDRRASLEKIGARPVKGVLFTGPPGTGKTHLARIVAKVSQADFFLVSGPAVVSKWVGDSEDTLRKIFEAAAGCERAIVFFDEIDSIAERRTGESHEASKRLVAQLLTLLDGFDGRGRNIVVIAATNRVESLDPALTRPGRFDWEIEFTDPTLSDRLAILHVGARRLATRGELPFADVAVLTEGWSAAELTAIWAEAALVAVADGRETICGDDMAQAYERVAARPRHPVKESA